jgi:hypothetical protein
MAEDIRVDVDQRAVAELFRDWNGPVGEAVQQVTEIVEDTARFLAPVSPVGSKFAPPGFLKTWTRQSIEHHYDPQTGEIRGLVGAPQYPFNFIASHSGFTANPRSGKHPGRGSRRKATDDYLARAIDAAPRIVIGRES